MNNKHSIYPTKKQNASWRVEFPKIFGFSIIEKKQDIPTGNDILWTTRCSKIKGCTASIPKNLYLGKLNIQFYKIMDDNNLRYAILSDKCSARIDHGLEPTERYYESYEVEVLA